jgi:MYXO-CTERM domain-containing protein
MGVSRIALVAVVAATLGVVSTAEAQSLRPNILIVFDSSGSMLRNDTDDGSPLCNNNGQSSRIFSLKKAIRDALAQVGTDEANFGLMRYPELDFPMKQPQCPDGHYGNDQTTALPVGCTNNCGNNCECGCRMPTHTTETIYGAWFDNGLRSSLIVDVTKRPTSADGKPVAGDFDPDDGNITSVYRWIDNTESAGIGPTVADPELRTHANWYTPIGRSIFYARMYFDNYVKPKDPKGSCRTNLVIFVTDGDETCDDGRNNNSTLNPTTCAATGYTSNFHGEIQACQLLKSGIKTYVLTDTSTSADNDRVAAAGGTTKAIRVTLTDTAAVRAALVGIIASTVKPPETCNGIDDNCNGQIDEGVSNKCPVSNDPNDADNKLGTGAKHCAVETCNCIDDDCDGVIDEGFPTNACGMPCGCALPPEKCDGLDNNCDGNIDEGFNVGMTCVNNGMGACRRGGILACNAQGNGTFCDAPVVTPSPEVCNNIDDNCDGQVDNGTLPGVGEACGSALGTCAQGKYACENGQLKCNTTVMPKMEVCNGLDDDCDGVVDNGNFPTIGDDCVCPNLDPAKVGVGVCKGGKLVCRGTNGIVCEGCIGPSAEICDGKDNDCDGMADMMAKCPANFGCREGACTLVCMPGEFPCPSGYKCVADYCVPQRCAQVSCPTDQHCDEQTGNCVDRCAGVTCNPPAICIQGACLDCEQLGCDPGQVCYEGSCRANKCAGVNCGAGEYCSDGKCLGLCPPGKCGDAQRCVNGACVDDKCSTVACASFQYCDPADGKCKADSCDAMQCQAGERCVSTTSKCEPDPCRLMQCPTDCWMCDVTADGKGVCVLNGQCTAEKTKTGQKGGGCSCAIDPAGPSSAPWALAVLGLAGALASRRRRR